MKNKFFIMTRLKFSLLFFLSYVLTLFVYPTQLHMAEHPAGHLVLKWLIEQDVMLAEAGKEGKKKKKNNYIYTHAL